ncbi:MAG: hypothetical protein ACLQVY_11355 [Limisphaerales bacterium]
MRRFSVTLFVAFYFLTVAVYGAGTGGDWPDFRGPDCDGHAVPPAPNALIGLPLRWSETQNVV